MSAAEQEVNIEEADQRGVPLAKRTTFTLPFQLSDPYH